MYNDTVRMYNVVPNFNETNRLDVERYRTRCYGYMPLDDLFGNHGEQLRSLGFKAMSWDGADIEYGRSTTWKRTDNASCIVAYVTREALELKYIDFRLKSVVIPMDQETARLLLSGWSNSQLMAGE
jgi:hypothetical protein